LLILCGHTHLPRVVRLGDRRLVVNAGSVGCPGYDGVKPVYHKVQTGTPDACYANRLWVLIAAPALSRYYGVTPQDTKASPYSEARFLAPV
jgi:hypothetical protein